MAHLKKEATMETLHIVLHIVEIAVIIAIGITLLSLRKALRNHVRKLKKMMASLREVIPAESTFEK